MWVTSIHKRAIHHSCASHRVADLTLESAVSQANAVLQSALTRAAILLGMALSGFFDGILLHQILQWHHFLSLVPGSAMQDIGTQILADGLFHVAIYLLTLFGLYRLWRSRAALEHPGAGRTIAGGLLLGFGIWNLIDVGVFHWVLGIHRVRVNVPDPLLYDLAWFVGLGLVVAIIGYRLLPQGGDHGTGSSTGGRRAAGATLCALLLAGAVSNIPPADGTSVILFRSTTTAGQAMNALLDAGGGVIFIDPAGDYALATGIGPAQSWSLYRKGALMITRSPALTGCLAFTRKS